MPRAAKSDECFTIDESLCTGCFNCQLICSITYEDTFNPEIARLDIRRSRGRTQSIQFKDDCTTCGFCAQHCMYGALNFAKEEQ
jgi:Fe-S-cluster-containing dehydrogenase component